MSFTFKEFFKDVCFCELLNQVIYIMCMYKLKMHFNKCLSFYEELLYLTNILLNFRI